MVKCPKCNGLNTKIEEELYYCNYCFHAWNPDPNAKKLYLEWVELDKSDRLISQIVIPGKKYIPQHINVDKMIRRSKVASELKKNHQHNIDLQPDVWYRIFEDAN